MKAIIVAAALAILAAGCVQLEQNGAQGGTSDVYARQFNNGFPYNPPGW